MSAAGYRIKSIVVRAGNKNTRHAKTLARRVRAKLVQGYRESLDASIVWLTVPDDAIADVAHKLAQSGEWKGRIVFHSSGALTSEELEPLHARGARVASVHPMMTFVRGTVPEMAGVAFALEGNAAAVRAARAIVTSLGGKPFVIRKENKVLYHAFGSFASPLVVALLATMEEVAVAAGIRKQDIKPVMGPLLRKTIENYLQRSAASAFSGPLARGDVATVRRHLVQLDKATGAKQVYIALAKAALSNLPVKNRKSLRQCL